MGDFSNPEGRGNGICMEMAEKKQKRLPGWKALSAAFGARARLELAHLSAADFES
jgi:hypothetical protein